jgi:hypothetical protein
MGRGAGKIECSLASMRLAGSPEVTESASFAGYRFLTRKRDGASESYCRVTKEWPRRDGELKAAELKTHHLAVLVDVLYKYDSLLHAVAIDVSAHPAGVIARHQLSQAEGITRFLTNEHYPSLREELCELRRKLERMPEQLYVQCVAMHQLLWTIVDEGALYFSQRRPNDLGKFEWLVDAKDPARITNQEEWWRTVIGPMAQSRSRRKGFITGTGKEFNYTYFDRAFLSEGEISHPDGSSKTIQGIDINKLITQRVSFVDSKSQLFIQVTDILTGFMRRALRSQIVDHDILPALGKLMIKRARAGKLQTIQLICLDKKELEVAEYLGPRLRVIGSRGRTLLKPKRT